MPEQSVRQAKLVCQRTKSLHYFCRRVCVRAAQNFSKKLAHTSMYCTMIIELTFKKFPMDLSVCLSCCSGQSVVRNCLEIISPINVLHGMTIELTFEMWVFHDRILPSAAAAPAAVPAAAPIHAQKTLP